MTRIREEEVMILNQWHDRIQEDEEEEAWCFVWCITFLHWKVHILMMMMIDDDDDDVLWVRCEKRSVIARWLTVMSTTVNSSAQHVSSTTTPAHDDNTNSLDRRLDFISVAIICGIIVACFVLCFIIGCRRTKRRRPPRCQDVSTPPVEPSRSGTVYIQG